MSLSVFLKSKSLSLYIYMLVTSLLLYARDVVDVSINKNIFIILCLSFSLTAKYENLVSLILFTLPLLCGLPGNYFLPVWGIMILYFQIRRRSLNNSSLVFWCTICIWELIIYCCYTFSVQTMSVVGYFSVLLVVCLLITEKKSINYEQPLFAFCLGCSVLLVIIILIYLADPTLIETGKRMGGDFYLDNSDMTLKANSNVLAYFSIALAVCSFVMFYYKKINLPFFIFFIIVAFISGIYTVSRTWVISMFLIIVLYVIFQKENKKIGYALVALMILASVYYFYNNPDLLDVFIGRFSGHNIETAGGRTELFDKYNEFFFNNIGNMYFGCSAQMYKDVTGIYNSIHNGLQQIWLSYGVVGFIIIVGSFIRILYKHSKRIEFMALLPIIVVLFFLQTIQLLNPYNGLYPIIAAFFIMKMFRSDSLKK